MELRFKFDPNAEQVTFDDLDTITFIKNNENEKLEPPRVHEFLSKFMVDENGQWIEPEEAFKIIGKLTKSKREEAFRKFMEAVAIAAVPLPREIPSPPPSEILSEASPVPVG